MKRVKVQSDEDSILIDCPNCGYWESLGIDDPRKRLSEMPIVEWKPDLENGHELSEHECTNCEEHFEVEWDYDNPIED